MAKFREGTKADRKDDMAQAKRKGMSMKAFERSPGDLRADYPQRRDYGKKKKGR